MKILFITLYLPVPPQSGQDIRNLSIIQCLAEAGHQLDFASFVHKGFSGDLHPLSSFCLSIETLEKETTNLTQHADYLRRIECLLRFKSYSVERFKSEEFQQIIGLRLQLEKYDVIICDGIHALLNIPETDVPIVLNCHFFENVVLEQYARLERNVVEKLYARMESRRMWLAERKGARRAACAMVCSHVDGAVMRSFTQELSIFVVPNVVDTDSILPAPPSDHGGSEPILLFHGQMDWYANRDAVEYFVSDILPLVRREYPKIKLTIAGRNPPAKFIDQFKSDTLIEFTGTVKDMRPYLAGATLVVVPLRLGSGTRIKILEACAAGRPVVSTSLGAEGLDLEDGNEIVLADDPVNFAQSIISMLKAPPRREAVGACARMAVVDRYSHATLGKSLHGLVSTHSSNKNLADR